jgi:hypothetical protein
MSTLRTLRKEYWLPAMIFLIGGLSVFLLLWSDRIAEKQRIQADLVDVLMDVQIHAAKAHLWVEQLLLGGTESDVNSFMIELSQESISLMSASKVARANMIGFQNRWQNLSSAPERMRSSICC